MNTPESSRILVVDDFEMARKMLRDSLRRLGYSQIEEAVDGESALDLITKSCAERNPYTIVFSDINMPKMNGIELLSECMDDPKTRGIPFVMISAETEREVVVQALKIGAVDYIIKPFSTQTVQKKIEKVALRLKKTAA